MEAYTAVVLRYDTNNRLKVKLNEIDTIVDGVIPLFPYYNDHNPGHGSRYQIEPGATALVVYAMQNYWCLGYTALPEVKKQPKNSKVPIPPKFNTIPSADEKYNSSVSIEHTSVGGGFLKLHTNGMIQVGSSPINQIITIPLAELMRVVATNLELITPVGGLKVQVPTDDTKPALHAEWRTSVDEKEPSLTIEYSNDGLVLTKQTGTTGDKNISITIQDDSITIDPGKATNTSVNIKTSKITLNGLNITGSSSALGVGVNKTVLTTDIETIKGTIDTTAGSSPSLPVPYSILKQLVDCLTTSPTTPTPPPTP